MYKNIFEFKYKYGFKQEGKAYYTTINGYQVAYEINSVFISYSGNTPLNGIIFVALDADKKNALNQLIKENRKELKILNFEIADTYVLFSSIYLTMKNGINNLSINFEKIISFLKLLNTNPSETYCPICNKEFYDKKLVTINSFPCFVDNDCANQIEEMKALKEEEERAKPTNYLKGAGGAFIGSLGGALVWILIGLFGYVSGWISLLTSFLAGLGYDKMKGKKTKTRYVIVSAVSLITIIISFFVVYIISVSASMSQEGVSGSPITMLFDMISQIDEFRVSFIMNFALSIVFGGLGIASWIGFTKRKIIK